MQALLLDAVRALLRARTEEEVVGVIIEVVRDVGGTIVAPTGKTAGELPIDVTFGIGEPLVPAGDDATLAALAECLPLLIEDAYVALQRTRREAHLALSASSDPLTGLANRRVTMRVLGRLQAHDTVVVIDLDLFKSINDTLGHDAGDVVLRSFARSLRTVMRAADTAGRLGGEEFALLLPRTDSAGAVRVVGRLRDTWWRSRPQPVTFSAGVAQVLDSSPREALTRADLAMYAAKANGRDRVEVANG